MKKYLVDGLARLNYPPGTANRKRAIRRLKMIRSKRVGMLRAVRLRNSLRQMV